MKGFIKDLIIVGVIVAGISIFVKPVIVRGVSMEPTLHEGDYMFVSRQAYTLGEASRGDVIVFPHLEGSGDEELYIKRIIALPGDHLVITGGEVYLNDKKLSEKYLPKGTVTTGDIDYVIPKGEAFVMGDNRGNSTDSRVFGPVALEDMTGQVFVRVFPFNKIRTF